jgi:hypothetical protein
MFRGWLISLGDQFCGALRTFVQINDVGQLRFEDEEAAILKATRQRNGAGPL